MKTVKGKLKHGMKIGDKTHFDFEMREPTTADIFDAEDEAGPNTPLKFNGAVIAQILVSVGEFKGPFSLDMIRTLKQADYVILREKMGEAEKLGEG